MRLKRTLFTATSIQTTNHIAIKDDEEAAQLAHPNSKTMPRSDEAEAFFWGVYAAVQEIPLGKVTTYGHIAALIGTRESHPLPLPPCHSLHHANEHIG